MAGRSIAISGAGIAGLTAALAFAARGFPVTIFERAQRIQELGAGIQLSPNATRLLASFELLDQLRAASTQPQGIVIRSAYSLAELAEVPLGAAEKRWGAPYLVLRRSDLQQVLLTAAGQNSLISIETGADVRNVVFSPNGSHISIDIAGSTQRENSYSLLIGADGVWSGLRRHLGASPSRFTGDIAYRTILSASDAARFTPSLLSYQRVSTFVAPGFHLVAYPLGDGAFNLVIIARGPNMTMQWENHADVAEIAAISARTNPLLTSLLNQAGPWQAWPIHEVRSQTPWSKDGRLVLIGDAAHALAPHAAQGAAMAIEDGVLLARLVEHYPDTAKALAIYEKLRRPRLVRVAWRGQFNHFAWQVGGPAALARNLILRLRPSEKLAADFDWLYGHDIEKTPLD